MIETFDTSIPSIVGASLVLIALATMAIVLLSIFGRMRLASVAMLGVIVGLAGVIGGGLQSRGQIEQEIDSRYGVMASAGAVDEDRTDGCSYVVQTKAVHSLSEDVTVQVRCA